MRTDFTPISNALNALIEVITSTHKSMLADANEQRRELIALHERMCDTLADMNQFTRMMRDTADQLEGVAIASEDISVLVTNTVLGCLEDVPTCDYEDFVGHCESCGETISVNDEYTTIDDELVCGHCADAVKADEKADPSTDDSETAAE